MDVAVQIALNALVAGATYALITLAFNLTYSTARFFDLGLGAIAVAGGYAVLFFYKTLEFNLYASVVLGVFAAAALGFLVGQFIYRPLRVRKATPTVLLIASLGVLIVVQAAIAILFGSQFQTLVLGGASVPSFHIATGTITETQIAILLAALAIMTTLGLTVAYTRFGKAVRAIADDEEVAQVVGINSARVVSIVFCVAAAIAGVAGIGTGFDTGLLPTLGLAFLLKGIIAAIVGGIGSVYGGVLGAFLLALVENIGSWQFSGEWRDTVAFAVLIAFLVFRPQGILPK